MLIERNFVVHTACRKTWPGWLCLGLASALGVLPFVLGVGVAVADTAGTPVLPTPKSAAVAASSTALPSMTLQQALRFARTHHPRIAVADAEIAAKKAESAVPRAGWKPRLGTTLQAVVGTNNNSATNWLGSGGAVEFPRIAGTGFLQRPGEINWKPYMSTAIGVGVEQRVFDFGRIAAESALADARIDVARYQASDTNLAVELSVREAYFALLAAKAVWVAAQDAVQRATVHRDETVALVNEGLRPRVQLERVEADLSRFEVGRVRAEGGIAAAQTLYAAVVGVEGPRLDAIDEPTPLAPLPPLEAALEAGEKRDPQLLVLDARLLAQKAETRALSAELLPELKVVATVMGAAGGAPAENSAKPAFGAGFVPWIPDYFAGLVLAWRFYDAPARARRDASARAEVTVARERASAQREVSAVIEQAWIGVEVAQRSMTALVRSAQAALANYGQAEARYRAGLATAVDLADAETLRTEAEIQVAVGQFEAARSRAQLARAIAEGS